MVGAGAPVFAVLEPALVLRGTVGAGAGGPPLAGPVVLPLVFKGMVGAGAPVLAPSAVVVPAAVFRGIVGAGAGVFFVGDGAGGFGAPGLLEFVGSGLFAPSSSFPVCRGAGVDLRGAVLSGVTAFVGAFR